MLFCGFLTLFHEWKDATDGNQDTHRIKGAWIQISGCMLGMTGLGIKMILEESCANDCPIYCPLPLQFNHNTVYHIFLGTGMYIQAHGMGILCTKGPSGGSPAKEKPQKTGE